MVYLQNYFNCSTLGVDLRDTENVRCKQVCCLALLMSACLAKKGAKFDHVVVFQCFLGRWFIKKLYTVTKSDCRV
jgi:hypothetical protein